MAITKILFHPIIIVIFTLLAIIFFYSLDKSGKKTQNSYENIRVLEQEVNNISGQIINLEEKINEAETQQFKEKVIRNELLLQKPGEYVLIIPEVEKVDLESADCFVHDCQKDLNETKITPFSAWMKLLFIH